MDFCFGQKSSRPRSGKSDGEIRSRNLTRNFARTNKALVGPHFTVTANPKGSVALAMDAFALGEHKEGVDDSVSRPVSGAVDAGCLKAPAELVQKIIRTCLIC
jgi:hypothetical protein